MSTPLAAAILDRLIAAGTWVARADLVKGLSTSPAALDDALADLVADGKATYRDGDGYRLAGGVLARRAAYLMKRDRARRGVFGQQVGKEYRVGVAELLPVGLVMFELAMPLETAIEAHMRQVNAVLDFARP